MILSPYVNELQKNHQYQGSSNDCGPYCAAMTLGAVKEKSINGGQLAQEMNKLSWHGILPVMRRIPNWATLPSGVRGLLRDEGLPARWKIFQDVYSLYDSLQEDCITIVIVGELRPLWAHYKILAAYDGGRGWGFVNSAYSDANLQWDTHALFFRQWSNFGRQVVRISVDSLSGKKLVRG